jgi:hypothetical protein
MHSLGILPSLSDPTLGRPCTPRHVVHALVTPCVLHCGACPANHHCGGLHLGSLAPPCMPSTAVGMHSLGILPSLSDPTLGRPCTPRHVVHALVPPACSTVAHALQATTAVTCTWAPLPLLACPPLRRACTHLAYYCCCLTRHSQWALCRLGTLYVPWSPLGRTTGRTTYPVQPGPRSHMYAAQPTGTSNFLSPSSCATSMNTDQ